MQLIVFVCLMILAPSPAVCQGGSSMPFKGRNNPFEQVLMLNSYDITLSRDSTRIMLDDGGILDLILKKKRPLRIRRFSAHGTPVDCGDLTDGTGNVRLRFGKHEHEAHFIDGLLTGIARFAVVRKDSAYTTELWSFEDGELDGESRIFSYWDLRYVAHVLTYEKGKLIRQDEYGKHSTWHAFIPFYPRITDPMFLCSRTDFKDGKLVKRECYVKKCRRCGM